MTKRLLLYFAEKRGKKRQEMADLLIANYSSTFVRKENIRDKRVKGTTRF